MKEQEKELLLVDLCARLPYGVIVAYKSRESEGYIKLGYGNIGYVSEIGRGWWLDCKPYLRPMSSMTKEERKEFESLGWRIDEIDDNTPWNHNSYCVFDGVDWLNKKMFAYRTIDGKDMFELGLALKAPEGMYNLKEK